MHVRNYAVALYLVPRQAPAGRALRRLTDRFSLFGCGERKRAVIDLFARDFRLRARTIIVETANRFARDLMVQEVGFAMLRDLGITLIAADSPTSFLDDGPTSKLIRQILGAVSEFDTATTVAKLKGARDRVRRERGKWGVSPTLSGKAAKSF